MELTPLEIKNLKNDARELGVSIYSVWSNEIRKSRKPSSVRHYVCRSKLSREATIAILIPFFKAQGYSGTVNITKGVDNYYVIKLSNRLQQKPH